MESTFFGRFHDLGAFASPSQSTQPSTQQDSTEVTNEPPYQSLFGGGDVFESSASNNGDADKANPTGFVSGDVAHSGASSALTRSPKVEEPTQSIGDVSAVDESRIANPVHLGLIVSNNAAISPPLSPQPSIGRRPSQVPGEAVVKTATTEASAVMEEIEESGEKPVEEDIAARVIDAAPEPQSTEAPEPQTTMRRAVSIISGDDRDPSVTTDIVENTHASQLSSPDLGHQINGSSESPFPEIEGITTHADAKVQEHTTPRQKSTTPPPPKTAPAKRAKRVSIAPDANTKRRRRTAAEIHRDAAGVETPKKRGRPRVSVVATTETTATPKTASPKKTPVSKPSGKRKSEGAPATANATPARVGRPRKSEVISRPIIKAAPGRRRATIAPVARRTSPEPTPKAARKNTPRIKTPAKSPRSAKAPPATEPRPRGRPSKASLADGTVTTPRVAALKAAPMTEPRVKGRKPSVATPTGTPAHTPKRRGRPPKNAGTATPTVQTDTPEDTQSPAVPSTAISAKRGRPARSAASTGTPKAATRGKKAKATAPEREPATDTTETTKRRGRPPKAAAVEAGLERAKTTRGRQPKTATAAALPTAGTKRTRGAAAEAASVEEPPKKRGRAAKTATEPTVAPAKPATRRGRPPKAVVAERQQAAPAAASAKRGRAAKKETGRAPEKPVARGRKPARTEEPEKKLTTTGSRATRGTKASEAKVKSEPVPKARATARTTAKTAPKVAAKAPAEPKTKGRRSGRGDIASATTKRTAAKAKADAVAPQNKVQSGRVTKTAMVARTGRSLRSRA